MCAALKQIPGITRADFDQESRFFHVEYHQRFVTPEHIFAAVWEAGKKMGKEYLPHIVT